ncbi:MAG: winged helix-turn-helix transcriptional regulator [Candidatus Micrarchaeia archaeon]
MYVDILSRKILRELCTDSRQSATDIAKKFGISRYYAAKRIAFLEKTLGLKYTLELDPKLLGISAIHILHASFSKRPSDEELSSYFNTINDVQFAAKTRGDFGLLLFVASRSLSDYFKWEISFWLRFAKYGIHTVSSEVLVKHLGIIPFNKETILSSSLSPIYKKMLAELNENSRMSIKELGERCGISADLARYYLTKMNENKIVSKYTAIVTNPPTKYNIVFFANYTVREGVESRVAQERREMYWRVPEEFPVVNEFQWMIGTTGGHSAFVLGTYENLEEGIERSVKLHAKIYSKDSAEVVYATIEKVLKGYLPIRNVDVEQEYDKTFI